MADVEDGRQPAWEPRRRRRRRRADVAAALRMPSLVRLVAAVWLVGLALSTTHAHETLVSAAGPDLSDAPGSSPAQLFRASGAAAHPDAQHRIRPRTKAVCAPQMAGWSLVANATLDGIGYLAAAVPVSRHILVLGGIAHVRDAVDAYTYVTRHTQRHVNLVNPRTYAVHAPRELVRNESSTVCPLGARCIEPVNASGSGTDDPGDEAMGLAPVSLRVPVVGAGSVVVVDGRVYAFGACNTVPDAVQLDLLRTRRRQRNDGIDEAADSEHVTPAPSPEAQAVEDYLRSVLRIRPFQKKFAGRDAHVLHQDVRLQPPSMTLRFNATCVSGANGIVYVMGGVNAHTGDTLASVAQYDTRTDTFVEGVWSLDAPVTTAAATSDNGLMFIAGGFSEVPDPSLFNPSRTRRDYHTSVAVVDTHRGLYDAAVAQYATPSAAEEELQWTAPQLFAHGARLYMLGSASDATAYRRLAYWADMAGSASQLAGSRASALWTRNGTRTRRDVAQEAAEVLHRRRSGSISSQTSKRNTNVDDDGTVFELGTFAFAPSRHDAALAMVPMLETPGLRSRDGGDDGAQEAEEKEEEDGRRTVQFFLLGGRLPLAAGGDAYAAEQQIFVATVTLCEGGSRSGGVAAAGNRTEAGTEVAGAAVHDRAAASLALPRVLGFSYTRVMNPATGHRASALHAGGTDSDDIPNQKGNTTVYVNGHEPLWYNFSFSVLLPLRETAAACPGVVSLPSATANASSASSAGDGSAELSFSSCALMLSTSPHCDAALAEFRYLSPRNTRRVRVPVAKHATGAAATSDTGLAYTEAIAVGRTLVIGSLEGGAAHVFFSGADGRHGDGATVSALRGTADTEAAGPSWTPPRSTRSRATPLHVPFVPPTAKTHGTPPPTPPRGNTLYYEQRFAYVCFSAAPSAVADCGTPALGDTTQARTVARPHASVSAEHLRRTPDTRFVSLSGHGEGAACSSRFYVALNPCKALVLSPVLTWTPRGRGDGDGGADDGHDTSSGSADPPTPSPEPPSAPHLLRPWMLLTICIVLLVVVFSGMLGSVALMPVHVFRTMHRGGGSGGGVGGGGGQRGRGGGGSPYGIPDDGDDQQRSLLPYHEARMLLLGAGGGGGGAVVGGGGNGAGGAAVPGLGHAVERFGFEDLPDEYETALAAAGVGVPGLSPFGLGDAGWAGSDGPATAATRRRVLDGKYEVVRKLGKGSFSVVYLVRRITDSKRFALKYVQCSDDVDRHEAMKECEVVYALQGHPNVIQLFDMFMSYRFDRHMVTVPGSSVAARHHERRRSSSSKVSDAAGGAGGKHPRRSDITDKHQQQPQQQQQPTPASSAVDDEYSAGVSSSSSATTAPVHPASGIAGAEANPVLQHAATTSAATTPMTTAAAAATLVEAATSTASSAHTASVSQRAVVHMDSAYLDAMTDGILRDPDASSSGATTPHHQRAAGTATATSNRDSPRGSSSGGGGGRHALQAERYLSLVMAYHERGDLARWVRQRRALQPYIPEATIVSIGFQVLSLLAYMHHRHHPPIIHRDLKPENILLTSHVHYEDVNEFFLPIVVTDFGLSRVMDKTFCETGVGSLPYVAPECWQRRYSTKVDIWALGCVLYAVCSKRVDSSTVKVMFSECTQADFHERLRDEVVHVYGYSPALAWFITALLAVKPDDRPTAADALRMLRRPMMNAAGEPVCDGPPLASLLRAASQPDLGSSSSSREPLRCADACTAAAAHAAAGADNGGSSGAPPPTPPLLLLLGDRAVSWQSSDTPTYTPDGSATPMDGAKSATSAPSRDGAALRLLPPHLTSVLQEHQQPPQPPRKPSERKESPLQPLHDSQGVSLAISHQTNEEDADADERSAGGADVVTRGAAAAHPRTPPSPPASELLTRVASTIPPPSGELRHLDVHSTDFGAASVSRRAMDSVDLARAASTAGTMLDDGVVSSGGARSTAVVSERVPSTFVPSTTSTAMPPTSPPRSGFEAHDL